MYSKKSIHCKSIKHSFIQGDQSLDLLKGIDFAFDSNQTYAITGVSGSGKSTLLHILAGLLPPTSGSVFFDAQDIYLESYKNKSEFLRSCVGIVFQLPYLISELTVLENIMAKGLINNDPYKECEKKALELLNLVDLSNKAHANPNDLSGGEAQRVAIARAIYCKSDFLFADEPTAHLDVASKKNIIDLLIKCHKEWKMGIILVTHDEAVASCMKNVLKLCNGKLL